MHSICINGGKSKVAYEVLAQLAIKGLLNTKKALSKFAQGFFRIQKTFDC